MFLLDTNILSELMRPAPEPAVVAWLNAQDAQEVWISSIAVAEIFLGIALLPAGKRKSSLRELVKDVFSQDFREHCLPFDQEAAECYAMIVADCKSKGSPISVEDAQIAAIAVVCSLTLVTRNIKDFINVTDLKLVNPWPKNNT